jgi:protoheme IX farnesyltransferase
MEKNKAAGFVAVYSDLIKFKLSLAVTFSSVTGYFIFHSSVDINLFHLIPGVFFLASGAAVLNQYSEIKYDALMHRTMHRPLPLKRLSPGSALLFSIILFCTGLFFLAFTGIIPVLLGILTVLIYNIVYTKLKLVTPLAILPGALVGAIPPLIGYEAAGGNNPGTGILLFSTFMFFWQLPHFWLILLKYNKEYEAAGFITFTHLMSEKQIRVLVFIWVLFSTLFLVMFSITGAVFYKQIINALIPLNILFILMFYNLLLRKSKKDNLGGAFMLVNSFSLIIMLLFIINSFLS